MRSRPGFPAASPFCIGRWLALITAAILVAGFWPVSPVAAQEKKAEKKAGNEKEDEGPSAPEDLVAPTGDGLQLAFTYYPGAKGKETVPVVLLHMWKQSRADYKELAPYLQSQGYAVIVPDLRGHGQSTRLKGVRKDETLNAGNMSPAQFTMMVTQDMKAVKDFLWERNNARELNIDKLCVVGAEMGASVAVNFAFADAVEQDTNRVPRAEYKLGRFVKALVLLSPERSFRGLPLRAATAYPAVQSDIAVLILVGKKNAKAMEEARRIHSIFEKYHPEPTGDDKIDKKTLFLGPLNTSVQGTKLLDPKLNLNVQAVISDFVNRRLVKSEESKEWTWKERKHR
jgi:pimeloyl-ACP methyl ester carboxylesterase